MTAITFDRVSKAFGGTAAVRDLSFTVERGSVLGFLGGNGAGKTTTLRMALGITRPDVGKVEVLGCRPGPENARSIGFLPEERGLYPSMSALDTIVYFGRLKGMPGGRARKRGLEILDRFGIATEAGKAVATLSKGMAQKVQIATALVNDPELLILDEPFSGLDPATQQVVQEEIRRFGNAGGAVIFSTHVMEHAERICDDLLVLSHGRKLFQGSQAQARARIPSTLHLVARNLPHSLPGVLSAKPEGQVGKEWTRWSVDFEPGRDPADFLEMCTRNGLPLRGFEHEKPSLHRVFMGLVDQGDASC